MLYRICFGLTLAVALAAVSCASAAPLAAEAEGETAAAHAEGEHELHIGAAGVDTNPLEFKSDLAIYTFVVFLVMVAVLWKFAWRPISEGLDRREQRITENIAAAQRSHDEAKRMLADYERKLALAHEDVRGIIDEARRDAEYTGQEILAKARADSAAEVARAKREIDTAAAQALKELAETSASLAVELAGKVIQAHLQPADHARLIEEALASFPQTDGRRGRVPVRS